MDDTRNVTKNGEENVDTEVGTATTLGEILAKPLFKRGELLAYLKEYTKRRKDDGENDLADV